MCGIAGWYRRAGRPVPERDVSAQCDTIRHRGPDDCGVLAEGDFAFGMRRLSIVDVAGGHQPMFSEDGRYAIIFNGEIYNHAELRPALEAAGHRFRTRSDTETLLAAWCHWGEDVWTRLEGMFAVAVWDRRARALTLARDPLGIKPLYLTEQNGGLAFASEIKALLPLPAHAFTVDPRAVHDFFVAGHVRPPRTIYGEVRVLPPGHALTLGPDGEARVHAYWRYPLPRETAPRRDEEWVEEFRALWCDTVARHTLADVPVGVFLSGGVDSSAVAAAMARGGGRAFTAFTAGFPGTGVDETAHARRVAEHLGCRHRVLAMDPHRTAEALPRIARCFDEPFADPAAVPLWCLSEMAAGEVKVVLAGDGGDEVFTGYRRHLSAARTARFAAPLRMLSGTRGFWPTLPGRRLNQFRRGATKLGEAARLPGGYARLLAATQITTPTLRASLLAPALAVHDGPGTIERLGNEYFPAPHPALCAMGEFLRADATLQLPGQMLAKVDRASMAHSLEVRVPFLSHRLVDWAAGVAPGLKLRGRTGKWILREAVAPWLPRAALDRRKQGFKLPLAEWFTGSLGERAREAWNDSGAASAGFLRPEGVEALFHEHRTGARDHARLLYAVAMFAAWWETRPRP